MFTWLNAAATINLMSKIDGAIISGARYIENISI